MLIFLFTYSISQTFGHSFSFKVFSLFLLFYTLWINIEVLNKPEYVLYFQFFKVATLCFDDSFAHSWHSLHQLHEVVTWNNFPTVLKDFQEVLSTRWLLFPYSAVQLIPNHLNWV